MLTLVTVLLNAVTKNRANNKEGKWKQVPTKLQKLKQLRRCILVNEKSKAEKFFDNLSFADMYLGQAPGYVARRAGRGEKCHDYNHKRVFSVRIFAANSFEEMQIMNSKYHSQQLCWDCKNACGRCSWSQSFTPVRGWVAEATTINTQVTGRNQKHYNITMDSYDIKECPLFERG